MSTHQLSDVLARLARLEAEREIVDTIHRFGHSIDYGLEQDWLDCFLPDGELEIVSAAGPGRIAGGTVTERGAVHQGREQLAAWIAGHSRPPVRYHKHLYLEPRITLDGDTASSVTYMTRVDRVDGIPLILAFGRYHDSWRRCEDGRWRLRKRQIEVEAQNLSVPSPYGPDSR